MREEDPQFLREDYRHKRLVQTIYGFGVSAVGFVILFTLPGDVWLRHTTGWLVILLGGMMINQNIIKDWFALFGHILPFGRRGGNGEG